MKKIIIIILSIGLIAFYSCNSTEDNDVKEKEIEIEKSITNIAEELSKNYKLVWEDNFDGNTLNFTKWGYRGLGKRRDGVNVKGAVSVNDGNLILTTTKVGEEFHTAMIGTQNLAEFTYGYFETRIKLQKKLGHWSAFWLQSPGLNGGINNPAKYGTEVDIYEFHHKMKTINIPHIEHAIHWNGYGEHHKSIGEKTVNQEISGWHTFGLLWIKNEYIFYIDGKETWRVNFPISRRSLYMILSLEVGTWAGDIKKSTLPDSLLVDYVKVFQKKK